MHIIVILHIMGVTEIANHSETFHVATLALALS